MHTADAAEMSVVRCQELLKQVIPIARSAGDAILSVYGADFSVRSKLDASPVTDADDQAEAIIVSGLARQTPTIPVVSEEAASAGRIPDVGRLFWIVDPLDGTKEFISRNGEFTVNIALIESGVPVLGVVFAPALGLLYGGAIGVGAFSEEAAGSRKVHHVRPVPESGLTVVSSRSHGDEAAMGRFLAGRQVASCAIAGSSLKFCLIAAGVADLYPRLGRTMEWDTAAGHAILRAAGGHVTDLHGKEISYCKAGFENPHFIAFGAKSAS